MKISELNAKDYANVADFIGRHVLSSMVALQEAKDDPVPHTTGAKLELRFTVAGVPLSVMVGIVDDD